jgi:hypothetical protein
MSVKVRATQGDETIARRQRPRIGADAADVPGGIAAQQLGFAKVRELG